MHATRTLPLLFILALLSIATAAAQQQPSDDANIQIISAGVSPQPARPGHTMHVTVNIENYGKEAAEDVRVSAEDNHPFHFRYSNQAYLAARHTTSPSTTISQIAPFNSYEAIYYFTVDPDAKAGEYELTFNVSHDDVHTKRSILIDVRGTPRLTANASLPDTPIQPGDRFNLTLDVHSVGTGPAHKVTTSLLMDKVPGIIALEDNTRFIQSIDPDETETVRFSLMMASDARPGSYHIPIRMSATDETGTLNVTSTETIGFDAAGTADLQVSNVKHDPSIAKQGQELVSMITLENTGPGEATSVSAQIEGLDMTGDKRSYIGKIAPDDDSPATFTLIPDTAGTFSYNLIITYEDDTGTHTMSEQLELTVRPKEDPTPFIIAIALIILAGGLYLAYRVKQNA